jgi:hypothetical protein
MIIWRVISVLPASAVLTIGVGCERESGSNKVSETSSKSPWVYYQKQDPVTKVTTGFARAHLTSPDLSGAVSEVSWSCPGAKIEDLEVEVSTYHDDQNSSALPQDMTAHIPYRFDGVVRTGYPTRDYSNDASIIIPGRADDADDFKAQGVAKLKQLYEVSTDGNSMIKTGVKYVSFVIADPDFAMKVKTVMGEETLEFSLDDIAIKKVLIDCGFTFGAIRAQGTDSERRPELEIPVKLQRPGDPPTR